MLNRFSRCHCKLSWPCSITRKIRGVFFKLWGSNLSQFFRIQFKGVRVELSAPICEREKKATSALFLPEASFPALDGGVDRLYTKAFLPWSDLACPLLTDTILIPPSSATEAG